MDTVAEHLRDTWTHQGLEVRGCSKDRVTVAVGPVFPVSRLCADVAARFDAEIMFEYDHDQGILLCITCPPDLDVIPKSNYMSAICLTLAMAAAKGLTIWYISPWTYLQQFANNTFNATL